MKEEKETAKQEELTEDNIDSTSRKNERAVKGAYRSFVIPEIQKFDIDYYVD